MELGDIKIFDSEVVSESGRVYSVKLCTDPEDGLTIMWYSGAGGPIIKGKPEEIKAKFLEAMGLADRVRKLRFFARHGKFPPN